jgi:cell division protein FtsQ
VQQVAAPRRDPAPSRTAYRMQRLWLTPVFRRLVRTGLPLAAAFAGGLWYLSDEARVEEMRVGISDLRASVEQRPEFMVKLMRIDNVSEEVADDIREVTGDDFPISSFDLDLVGLRARIEELDAVASAQLVIRKGGVLDVQIVERVPAVVWRGRGELELLDETGHRVAPLESRGKRADLPLIAGDGADRAVQEALSLVATAAPVAERVRGLLRVGERRWDLILDRNQRIMLPEAAPVAALERILALNEVNDLLNRDVVAVDLRDAKRPTLRLSADAVEFLHQVAAPLSTGDDNL